MSNMGSSAVVLINKRNEYLFADEAGNKEGTIFTLTNRSGDIIRKGVLPIDVYTFVRAMKKSGYIVIEGLV